MSLPLDLIQNRMDPLHALFQEDPLQYPKDMHLSNPRFSPKTVYIFHISPMYGTLRVHTGLIEAVVKM
jgi:hypothetical protein